MNFALKVNGLVFGFKTYAGVVRAEQNLGGTIHHILAKKGTQWVLGGAL